ncbi:anthranilate synthase component I family protein [Candidatus Kirkpatrickella diaphorinae]|uniref:Anthranilate synthase component I family protein n=1 Tax=Candidatus Kirkpatrickella diaphorinae TaxID=2984322 RepID=A0ABY6GIM9_9PROT|nr:anthranilate synthase component I family protein [Candidatus Kirkpatrickella diaphorinae]UYH51364.1 anthranilate synthase component I family protein [Candidatus Kirkpatrickella diaphorinae]
MTKIELAWRTPEALLTAFAGVPHLAFLDSGGIVSPRSRWSILCVHPREILSSDKPDAWDQLRGLLHTQRDDVHRDVPFSGGVIGLASYEAGLALEGVRSRFRPLIPALTAMAFDGAFVFDRQEKRLFWCSDADSPMPPVPPPDRAKRGRALPRVLLTPDMQADDWKDAVEATRASIGRGDLFQANLTSRWRGALPDDADIFSLYLSLRETSPAPFGGFIKLPQFSLLSASVERFISLDRHGWLETRPIKGTAPISRDGQENTRIAENLAHDSKEYGENLMITDLMRNDIARVCEVGSVSVPALCEVERFTHVHHLVSTVRGKLARGKTAVDLMRASLPPGSVTGAPKHAALQLIDRSEGSARNAYCGTMFWIGNDGAMDSNVVIRSILISGGKIEIGAGGGITYPSDPQREFDEMCLKAEPLLKLFR